MRHRRHVAPATILTLLPLLIGCGVMSALVGRFEEPQLTLRNSKVDAFSPAGVTVTLFAEIYNPNPYTLRAQDLKYQVVIGGAVLAEGQAMAEPVELLADTSVPLELRIQLPLDRLMAAARPALTMGEIPYELRTTMSIGALMMDREVTLVRASALRVNLPLGLVAGPRRHSGEG
jgi:LEA14-like dessication related protein